MSNSHDIPETTQVTNDLIAKRLDAIHHTKGDNVNYDVKTTSYSMIVLMLMDKVGMQPVEKVMSAEADLENILAKIQGDMVSLSSFLSKLENNSTSTKRDDTANTVGCRNGILAPNTYNGLDPSLFNNPTFINEINSFTSTFKQLYYSNSGNTGMSFKDISTITGVDGKSYDLTSYWNKLGTAYGKLPGGSYTDKEGNKHYMIDSGSNGAQSSDHASLFQIYVYAKLKLQLLEKGTNNGLDPNNPDLTKIFYPDPSPDAQGTDDGICSMLTQFLNSFDTTVTVQRDDTDNWGESQNRTTGDILGLILNGPMDDTYNGRTQLYDPGLKTALSYMAFNYFWTKNPDYSGNEDLYPPPASANPGRVDDRKGVAHGDLLSDTYANSTNAQSLIGSNSQEQTTDMQEKTTIMGQFDNIGQNVISQDTKAENNTVGNYKSA